MKNKSLAALCLIVVFGLLGAGLWPFNTHPRNEVSWSPDGKGLRFGAYGTVLGSRVIAQPISVDGSCTVEIFLTPGLADDSNTILAFSVRDDPPHLQIGQAGSALYVLRDIFRSGTEVEHPYINIAHVFQQGQPVLLTVTAGPQGTEVYVNGGLARTRRDFGLSARDLTGNLVIANSPVGNDSWSGLLQGMAFYGSELSATEVSRHYHDWSTGDRTILTNLGSDTLYLFREGTGRVVRNMGPSRQTDLYIPDHYVVLHPQFLRPFWKDNYLSVASLRDISVNIWGFAPLGFLLNAVLWRFKSRRRSFRTSVLLGALLSLIIEVLQYFLPMRVSDSMDVLTNTLGTMIGAWLYILEVDHGWLARVPVVGEIWNVVAPADSHVGPSERTVVA
jgi:VanZ family protein